MVANVDERLTWMRSWNRWDSLSLDSFRLRHTTTEKQAELARSSALIYEELVEGPSIVEASHTGYALAATKTTIMTLVTGKGFAVTNVMPPPKLPEGMSVDSLLSRVLHDQETIDKARESVPSFKLGGAASGFIGKVSKENETLTEWFDSAVFPDEAVQKDIHRNFVVLHPKDIERDWSLGTSNFAKLPLAERVRMARALQTYASGLMIRELYSRYMIAWAALDLLTPYVDKLGDYKTRGMASHIKTIDGVQSLAETLDKLYKTRNDISHSRRNDSAFPTDCKKRLLMLEFILVNHMRSKLGINQLGAKACPSI